MYVRRTLPHRTLRTIGAFCFVDHYGPSPTSGDDGHPMVVPPHPHTGLQTVSWLLSGTVDHRDSLGSVQRISPGELNLMTAGNGIVHSEYSVGDAPLHGVQLWIAMPDAARHQEPHFEHHGDLPHVVADGFGAQVVMGALLGGESKARTYSPLVCAELHLSAGRHRLPVEPSFEHGVLALSDLVSVAGEQVERGSLRYLPPGVDELELATDSDTTALLIGGVPFDEELLMWWNFVGRTHDEIEQARADWETASGRFGTVAYDDRAPMSAPELPTVRLRSRPQRPG
jgi:redox-sensitive bicupin YhaK (pirin superfamily)